MSGAARRRAAEAGTRDGDHQLVILEHIVEATKFVGVLERGYNAVKDWVRSHATS
jgi:hypothetical protein